MSYLFQAEDVPVWWPALRVGRAFVGCAQALSDVVEVPTGFVFNSSDMLTLDIAQHRVFVDALAKIVTGQHPVFASLARSVWAPCVVMVRRTGVTVDIVDDELANLVERLAATMAS